MREPTLQAVALRHLIHIFFDEAAKAKMTSKLQETTEASALPPGRREIEQIERGSNEGEQTPQIMLDI